MHSKVRFAKLTTYFFLGALIGTLILVGAFFLMVFSIKVSYNQKTYPGVSIFHFSVAGQIKEDLALFMVDQEAKRVKRGLVFRFFEAEPKSFIFKPETIDFAFDREKIINEAFAKGRDQNDWQNLWQIGRLLFLSENIEPKYQYDNAKLEAEIEKIAKVIDQPVQEALFEFKNNRVSEFKSSKDGRGVDRQAVKLAILSFLLTSEAIEEELVLDLPVKTLEPKITTSQSNNLGIKELLGEGESFFKDSIPSRIHNIILASSKFHGVVLAPGEVFSFAQKIGDISQETGYEQAYVIKDKKTVLEDGGGVCQVSTTLFRAALSTGLPIVERQAHYYRVGFYEQGDYPPGLDATVYPPKPDLKFKNDTPTHLLIQTEIDKAAKRLVFKFYGTKDGRKVELTKPIIHSQIPPPEPVYVDDPVLALGTTQKLDSAHWGAKVSFIRRVFNINGDLVEEKTFWSNYTAWAAVYLRGTKI